MSGVGESHPSLWVCYCGVVKPFDPGIFPHRDCDGGRPLSAGELAEPRGPRVLVSFPEKDAATEEGG